MKVLRRRHCPSRAFTTVGVAGTRASADQLPQQRDGDVDVIRNLRLARRLRLWEHRSDVDQRFKWLERPFPGSSWRRHLLLPRGRAMAQGE